MTLSLTKEEKIVLVAVVKYILSADRVLAGTEMDRVDDLAREKGLEDFQEIFAEVDRTITSLDDLRNRIRRVVDDGTRRTILEHALAFARADATIQPEEIDIMQFMASEWNINLKAIMED